MDPERYNPEQPQQTSAKPPSIDIDRLQEFTQILVDNNKDKIKTTQSEAEKRGAERNFDKFAGISDILNAYQSQGLSPDNLVALLTKERDQAEQQLSATKDDALYVRREKRLQAVEDTIAFIKEDLEKPYYIDNALRIAKEKQAEKAARQLDELKKANAEEKEEELHETREQLGLETEDDPEKLEQELIDQVLTNGAIVFNESLPSSLRPDGNAGFTAISDKKVNTSTNYSNSSSSITSRIAGILGIGMQEFQLDRSDSSRANKQRERRTASADQVIKEENLAEILYSEPISKDVQEEYEKTEEIKKGLFKKETVTTKHTRKIGDRPAKMSEETSIPSDEPAARILYATSTEGFQDYSGRLGQCIKMELVLPQGLATRVMRQAKKNPNFIHKIIDQIATKDMGIPEESWHQGIVQNGGHPLRPPFEQWTREGKKAYVAESKDLTFYDQSAGKADIDPDCLRNF